MSIITPKIKILSMSVQYCLKDTMLYVKVNTITQICRKLAAERTLKDIRDEYNYPKKKSIKDECSRLLEASTMKSRRGFAIQRLMNAMRQAHADGWFIVFDTLTLADDRLEAFYDNPNALRDYFRDIGRMVLAAEGRKANDS